MPCYTRCQLIDRYFDIEGLIWLRSFVSGHSHAPTLTQDSTFRLLLPGLQFPRYPIFRKRTFHLVATHPLHMSIAVKPPVRWLYCMQYWATRSLPTGLSLVHGCTSVSASRYQAIKQESSITGASLWQQEAIRPTRLKLPRWQEILGLAISHTFPNLRCLS